MNTVSDPLIQAPTLKSVLPGSEELRALVDHISATEQDRERDTAATRDVIERIRAAGLGLFRLPVSEGGAAATLPQVYELVLDLAAADSNIPHILRNHFAFVEKAKRAAHLPQYRRWLERVRAGELFGLGASEIGTQNVGDGDGNTRLVAHGSGFRLTGKKYYSTGNLYFDHIIVNAKAEDGSFVAARVSTRQPGVDVQDDWDGIGQRNTASGTTVFTDVEVDANDVLPLAEDVRIPHQATFAQLWLTTIIAGIVRRIATDATGLLGSRERNYYHASAARPADDPLLQHVIGELQSAAYVAESAVLRAAVTLDRAFDSSLAGHPDEASYVLAALQAAKSKVAIDDLALRSATHLFNAGGASAARESARFDRHWRNIRTISSHNPVVYKARAIGEHAVNGVPLPRAAFF
jgi:alkylation response protein AidB-like acyl-CoA dehydrogenase